LYYFLVPLIYLLDQLSKFFIEKLVLQGSSIPVVKNVFHITLVRNTGAAFGILRKHPHLFIVIAVLVAILIGYFLARRMRTLNTAEKVALCFILGGTLGNLTDRIRLGYVIDFIDFRIWPVFNLADVFITAGAAVLVWMVVVEIKKR
jgi:signal peptidase II